MDKKSSADVVQGSLLVLTVGSPGTGEGGGVCCLGTTGSGTKERRCRAISAPSVPSSSF